MHDNEKEVLSVRIGAKSEPLSALSAVTRAAQLLSFVSNHPHGHSNPPLTTYCPFTHSPPTMSLPMHLRAYRDKSKDELARDLFNVPLQEAVPTPSDPPSITKVRHKEGSGVGAGMQGMEISAVLSVEGKEEVYVGVFLWSILSRCCCRRRCRNLEYSPQAGKLHLLPPFLCFISLDRRSCRCTLPLYTIRRVERYVYAAVHR